jgi:excisionase family DNA binding protein
MNFRKEQTAEVSGESIDVDRMLTYTQAAEHTGIALGTLYAMVARREIPHFRLGRRIVRFSTRDLHVWMRHRRVPAGEAPRE